MADDQTKIIISLDLILRNLERTLRGLSQVERQLKSVASIKIGGTTNFDKAAAAAQRLQLQQGKLAVQAQELANREERARQTTERLALARERLSQATARQVTAESRAAAQVARINAQTARQAAQQEAIRTRAAKTIADVQIREAQRGANAFIESIGAQAAASARFRQAIETFGNSMRSLGQAASTAGIALSIALTAPLVALGKRTLDAAVTIDSLKLGLTAIVGSAAEAGAQLARLTEIAKLPGIGFQEAIQGSIRLQAVGFSAKEAEKALREFSNAIALTGGGRDELNRVTVQLGQLAAKGKVLSQDLRPIIEAAPAVGRALKQAFGTVNADDIAELTGSSREFLNTLITELENLPRAAGGAKNAFENFKDELFRAAAAVGDALIPVLTRLAEIVVPIISKLAEGFKQLPAPLQTVIVLLGGLATAFGPVLFIFGQLITASGRALVGLAQLNVGGIGPTIANLRALAAAGGVAAASELTLAEATTAATAAFVALRFGIVLTQQELAALAVASLTAAEAEAALGAGAILATGGLAAIGILLGGLVAAWGLYASAEEKAVEVDLEGVKATKDRVEALEFEIGFLKSLGENIELSADANKKLEESYASLSGAQRFVIDQVEGEIDKRKSLIEAKKEELRIDNLRLQGAATTAVEKVSKALASQEQHQRELNDVTREFSNLQKAIRENGEQITGEFGEVAVDLGRKLKETSIQGEALRIALDADQQAAEEGAKQVLALAKTLDISVDALLEQARAAGASAKEIENLRKVIDRLKEDETKLVPVIEATNKALLDRFAILKKLSSEPIVVEVEAGEDALKGVLDFLKATTSSLAEAKRGLENFIFLTPELKKTVDSLGGVDKVLENLFKTGSKKTDTGTALRSAKERLADALLQVSRAAAEQEIRVLQAKNDKELERNEAAFKLQLISYREYLQRRADLTTENINQEITKQQIAITKAKLNQARLQAAAQVKGIPEVERVRRLTEAARFEEDAIRAETKLKELGEDRIIVQELLAATLAENSREQVNAIRQLEVEYGKLQGRIESALKQETTEEFRETLENLARTQERLNDEQAEAAKKGDADALKKIAAAKDQNQRQIELINNTVRLRDSQSELAGVEAVITDAKERQSDLEKQIAADVDFRGLKETEAIRRRLAGEEELKQVLIIQRNTILESIKKLGALTPPPELLDRVVELNQEIERLGKLTFTEQFDLAAKEFQRIQDELRDKIEQVELAVRHRDLAEIQGRILIKKLNGEYVADLERQAEILRQIAKESGDQGLLRQAANAQATAREVRASTTEVASFGKALRSVSIDALQEGFADFFRSVADRSKTAQEKVLDFLDSINARILDFIAQNLSEKLIESIFGTPAQQGAASGGILAAIKRLFGFGDGDFAGTKGVIGAVGEAAGKAGTETAAATAAATALTTGATAASAAMATGGAAAGTAMTTGGVSFTTSIAAAAAGFASTVAAAGAAFAAAVAAAAGAQAAGGAGSGLAGVFGAATGMFPATPGGLVRIVEGGFDEAVLTTDPKFAAQQVRILQDYLRRTKGLFGRIQGFEAGGFITPAEAEVGLLSSVSRSNVPSLTGTSVAEQFQRERNLRLIFVDDQRDVRNWMNSAEGDQTFVEKLHRNQHVIRRLK